jgi:hypothetical protein
MNDNVKTIKKSQIYWGIFGFVVLLLIVLYSIGFRFAGGLKIGRVGTVTVTTPLVNTNIFVDKSDKITTKKDNETVKLKLSPKKHSIIISRESYYPWKKDLEIKSNSDTKLDPLFVSQNPSGNIIGTLDPEYWSIVNKIKSNVAPTESNPLKSADGKVMVWVNDGSIFAKIDNEEKNVVDVVTPVKNINFYKNRTDAIIFSTTVGVYVIEMDKTGGQNFMPIYKGQNPFFVADDTNFIYIQDNSTLMQVFI